MICCGAVSGKSGNYILIAGPQGAGEEVLVAGLAKGLASWGFRPFVQPLAVYDDLEVKIKPFRDWAEREDVYQPEVVAAAEMLIAERARILSEVGKQLGEYSLAIAAGEELRALALMPVEGKLTREEVFDIHRKFNVDLPSLAIIVNCSPQTAENRLARVVQTRREGELAFPYEYEKRETREEVHLRYRSTAEYLESQKLFPVLSLNTDGASPDYAVLEALDFIKRYEG